MSENNSMKTEEEMADEVFAHRHEAGEWAEEPDPIAVRPSGSEVVSVRLPVELVDRLETAASAQGETVSQFVRAAIQARLDGVQVAAVDRLASNARRMTVRHLYG
ncbi:MAG: ribbon-helix-helix protein, CopG family, partial [Actinobacteria bacterium]|nr:ribbon-helix-helix protein, CopG family [Actinomycetota bacterium]